MVYDRNSRNSNQQGRFYGQDEPLDDRRDYGAGRDFAASSARDYAAVGEYERQGYGQRDYSDGGYNRYGQPSRGRGGDGRSDDGRSEDGRGGDDRGGYAPDARRYAAKGRYRGADDDRDRDYGRPPQGYDYDDRGFIARAGDEVRSWFGDEDAEHRRAADARYDDRRGGGRHDDDYHQWRSGQISALDRDYHEYRQENRSKFENEFTTWRTTRQGQRDLLGQVKEHHEVVGSDGEHVGTVDKVRDDRILLAKIDADAGGRRHSIASRWIATVDDTVTLSRTAAEAKAAWEDEDRNAALFDYGDNARDRNDQATDRTGGGRDAQGRVLNRSFSGTY